MSLADELEKLNRLKESGTLSEEEYQKAKASLLRQTETASEKLGRAINGFSSDENLYGMFVHLSHFCGYLLPLAGLVVPIVLWQIKKDQSPLIDRHGKVVTNWIISEVIYLCAFGIMSVLVVGLPLLFALGVVSIVFPIIGGIKAKNGEVWSYPLSIKFFPVT